MVFKLTKLEVDYPSALAQSDDYYSQILILQDHIAKLTSDNAASLQQLHNQLVQQQQQIGQFQTQHQELGAKAAFAEN